MAEDSSTSNLHKLAIDAALNSQWDKALEINLKIIELDPKNVECMNRLAKAYMELGQLKQAQKIYHDVLEIDQYNNIAQKNLKKISSYKDNAGQKITNGNCAVLSPAFFVSEPGITKSVNLLKIAEPQKLLSLSAGMMVSLVMKSRGILVTDINNGYLGVLPDDLSFHLMRLMKGGNKYQAFIQSVKSNSVTILIRETYRAKKFKNQASFLEESKIFTYSLDHIALLSDEEETSDLSTETEEVVI